MASSYPGPYRTHRSFDSNAPSESYGPVSHTSACSWKTHDPFDDSDDLSRRLAEHVRLQPGGSKPQAEATSQNGAETKTATAQHDATMPSAPLDQQHANAGCLDEQGEGSWNSIPDAEDLRVWTEQFVRKHPVPELETASPMAAPVAQEPWIVPVAAQVIYYPVMVPVAVAAVAVPADCQPIHQQAPMVVEIDAPATTSRGSDGFPSSNPERRPRNRSPSRSAANSRPNATRRPRAALPPASEEEWARRIAKREEGLEDLCTSDPYTMNQDIRECVGFGAWAKRPVSPKPNDRTMSKRDWEAKICEARIAWRRIHGVRQLVCEHGFQEEPACAAWKQADEHLNLARCILLGFQEKTAKRLLKQAGDDLEIALQFLEH